MTTNKKIFTILSYTLTASPFAVAEEQIPLPRPIVVTDTQQIVNAGYLYSVLPDSALAYIRIPSLWWPIGGVAIGSIFDQVVQSAPHAEAIYAIRRGILDRFLPEIPQEWRGLAKFLLSQVNTPLEIAVLPPPKEQPLPLAIPELLITTGLNQNSVEAANSLFQTIVTRTPGLEFPKPLQADGSGKLIIHGKPIDLYFNAIQQRLFIKIALPSLQAKSLIEQISLLKPTPDHPMLTIAKNIDETGQGLLLWLNPKPVLSVAKFFGLANELAVLQAIGIADARSITFGIGGSGGKQHLKFILDMPQTGAHSFLPTLNTDIKLNAANGLDTVLMLGLPNSEYLTNLESNLKIWLSNEDFQSYTEYKKTILKSIGLTAEQVLDTFGTEMMLIHDQAGYYLALRLRNSANFQTLLTHLIQKFELKYKTKDLLGTTFHHLVLPPFTKTTVPNSTTTNTQTSFDAMGLIQMLIDRHTHLYWIERDGYLVFADVPQLLMDILYSTPKVNIANWLHQSQGINPTGALALISTRATGIPRLLYEIHLWSLSYWGDLVGNEIDLFSLPSAHELNLPNSGAYSIQFTTAPNQLALEAVYESNPFEALISFGFQTLASVGIVAAIAIPSLINDNQDEPPQITECLPNEPCPQLPQQ